MKIRVPATTANIGPGFDTMGIALNLYNYFELEEKKKRKPWLTLPLENILNI